MLGLGLGPGDYAESCSIDSTMRCRRVTITASHRFLAAWFLLARMRRRKARCRADFGVARHPDIGR